MGLLEKFQFHLWDGFGMVCSLIDEWEPGKLKSEKSYEKSLYEFLHNKLEDIQVTKQYAKKRIRADIVVGDQVIIELKHNLDTTAKYQRLLGQISEYSEWKGAIIVLLTGKTDPNLKKELMRHIKKLNKGDIEERYRIIEK